MNVSTVAPSLAAQITNLPKLAMNDLWTIWDKYFPRRPPHNNRAYVEGRVAYKIQEEAFGTKLVVQTQMARIGEAQSRIKTQRGVEVQVVPGTVSIVRRSTSSCAWRFSLPTLSRLPTKDGCPGRCPWRPSGGPRCPWTGMSNAG